MKYVLSALSVLMILVAVFFCAGQAKEGQNEQVVLASSDFLRIHIVANSQTNEDEAVQYFVKDAVVEFLIPLLCEATTKDEAQEIVEKNLNKIVEVAKCAASACGANYSASAKILSEYIPLRAYESFVLSDGEYVTLRIQLGSGAGNNWWCVLFPAVCFLDTQNPANFEYVSILQNIINSIFG